jgi:1,4-alpha-glucan branching enzyme
MGEAPGELAFVLHTHLPYLRNHGVWPVGEEWLFQAWAESWLPVTRMLLRLAEDGHTDVLTLGVTPLVAHQVADRRLANDLGTWLGSQMWRAEEQRSLHGYVGDGIEDLGTFYWKRYAELSALHEDVESRGGLLAVWADLASRGVIELLGGPATHPYLPLQTAPGLIDAQLASGLDHHQRWAGARPTGIWAPECGYRPAGRVADATATPTRVDRHGTPTLPRTGPDLPGLETVYAGHGVDHFLVDAATLVRAAGGGDRDWTTRPDVPDPAAGDPYEVVHDGVLVGDSDVVAFARDLSVAYHVWSPAEGYPGDPWYRDFFARGDFGLHPSWRVTDKTLSPMEKAVYDPVRAGDSVRRDVAHLHGALHDVLDPRPGDLVVAAYDTELFGHWWFEGVDWLEGLLRTVADDPALRTTTLASRVRRRPPTRRLHLPESSWGFAKGHGSWVTAETRPLWTDLRHAERRAADVLARADLPAVVADQIARELALLTSSDWPFMITRGNSAGYAFERFSGHLSRLEQLCDAVAAGDLADAAVCAARLAALDDAPADPSAFVAALSDPEADSAAQVSA